MNEMRKALDEYDWMKSVEGIAWSKAVHEEYNTHFYTATLTGFSICRKDAMRGEPKAKKVWAAFIKHRLKGY